MAFLRDLKFALRSLARAKGLTAAVALTLALGIGGNVAIFSLFRGILLRPLPNRDEGSLIYIRQSAPVSGIENTTFSMPEIQDLRSRVKTIRAFGDFSATKFTMIGLGEPREVRAGIVSGDFFDVMGLQPALGRLVGPSDDGANASGAVVLTHCFWATVLRADPDAVGKVVRLGVRSATVIGVLQPAPPYPTDTEIIANVVTSPHHLSAVMVQGRAHRMTELFGRLAPGVTVVRALADLRTAHASMVGQHPEVYGAEPDTRISAVLLRDQITGPPRKLLIVLLTASLLVFVVACSNAGNMILARSVGRETELAVRSALGASRAALRRALLADSILLCGAGAGLGVAIARPVFYLLAQYSSRFSVRALDLTVDATMMWSAGLLALVAALFLAFIPRLPGAPTAASRVAAGTSWNLRFFASVQIAASFVLLSGSLVLANTLLTLQNLRSAFDTKHVLAVNLPVMSYGRTPQQTVSFYTDIVRRIAKIPGVNQAALGTQAPGRDAGSFGPGFQFSIDGHITAPGEAAPRAFHRTVSPGFFPTMGIRLVAGRDFNDGDRDAGGPVVIVSESLARRAFPNQNPLNRYIRWTDPVARFINISAQPRRIIGIAADANDETVESAPMLTVYHPFGRDELRAGRLFIHSSGDPLVLASAIRNAIHEIDADQPVEKPSTLEDIRAEIFMPERLRTLVLACFALIALSIALAGVAGVLSFSTGRRTREFGIRMAVGSDAREPVRIVMREAARIAFAGIAAGGAAALLIVKIGAGYFDAVRAPGVLVLAGAAALLGGATFAASIVPARRAAGLDVIEALRRD